MEERLTAVVRNLCTRWSSFDFRRQLADGDLLDFWDAATYVSHPAELLGRDINEFGAVGAIQRRLEPEQQDDVLAGLAAWYRLDLSIEFLALRPAWKTLFSDAERRRAAIRLHKFLVMSLPEASAPLVTDDLDGIVEWLEDKIVRCEVVPDLPKTCKSVGGTACEFSETGLIPTSLTQCVHYLNCRKCLGEFPQLEKRFRRFETDTIRQCRELLRILRVCVERAGQERKQGVPVGRDDEFAWRAIVCGAGLTYIDSIREVSRILSEVERGEMPEQALRQLLLGFDQDELYLLSFAEAASQPFIEVQWSLYDNDDLIYLPSDGDLWDIPGAVEVLDAPDVSKWKRLMTGSDLEFSKRQRNRDDGTLWIDGDGLFYVLNAAAALQAHRRSVALGRENVNEDRSFETLFERLNEIRDLVASNSAAQVPMIDTLQSLVHNTPSWHRAETSLRGELGDALFNRLSAGTLRSTIAAEYYWLANTPDPSIIVFSLAKAFECELRESVFLPFCKKLLASGIRDFPEPGQPVKLPPLMKNGKPLYQPLGAMQKLLKHPELSRFLEERQIRKDELMEVLREVKPKRDSAAHDGQPVPLEDVAAIRERWLGKTGAFPNIFAVLAPDIPSVNTTGAPQ